MSETPEGLLNELGSESQMQCHPLSIELFSNRSNKTTKLVENADPANFINGANRFYSFALEEPVFVRRIEVHTLDYGEFYSAEFSWQSIRRNFDSTAVERNTSNVFAVSVNDVLQGFSFKPDRKYIGDPKIVKVSVFGLTLREFEKAISELCCIDGYQSRIISLCSGRIEESVKAQQRLSEVALREQDLINSIDELSSEKESLESELEKLRSARQHAVEELNQKAIEESNLNSKLAGLTDAVDEKTQYALALNSERARLEMELGRLKSNINLFPTEISSFVEQGARSIEKYMLLAFLPIVMLVYVVWYLFGSAAGFASAYSSAESSEVLTIFLSRIPFMVVSLGIISASYKLSSIFISEIMRINRQRLNLSKISIVAKDVSESSENELDLNESERYELRTKLKMDLLKSHLKGYIEDGYSYTLGKSLRERFALKEDAPKSEE